MKDMLKQMPFEQTIHLTRRYNINTAPCEMAHSEIQAAKASQRFGYPVVLKLISPEVVHKTEKGFVLTGIDSMVGAQHTYKELVERAHKLKIQPEGVLIQKQFKGREIIIGAKRDEQFGPTVLFGLGGVFVEILKDISLRIAPINKVDAMEMIKEIKGYALLAGARGQQAVNFEKIAETISAVSNMIMDNDEIVEMDLNPCFADEKECIAVDIRIMTKSLNI